MRKFVLLDKAIGETPLAALNAWRVAQAIPSDIPLCYAGRLDPMASGKLLVLIGDECKVQERYRALDKEYEIEVLLDVGSDTGDALGVVSYADKQTKIDSHSVRGILKAEQGTHERLYPAFSSKTIAGKPLFLHSLEGNNVSLPAHKEHIYRILPQGASLISHEELRLRIERFLTLVPTSDEPSKALGADFRITAVRASWRELFSSVGSRSFAILRFKVTCGSGTYMRTLAQRIGEALGTKALALSITRTRIGKYFFGVWCKTYS